MEYDVWAQVVEIFKDYRNVAFRVTNEFHGYKYEQTLDPGIPDDPDNPKDPNYLTSDEARAKFIDFITEKGRIARTIKPDGWVFYRNGGQLVGDMVALDWPLGIDPEPTDSPAYAAISHNYNTSDSNWGYWGLNDLKYTHDFLKHVKMNRKAPPQQESAALLASFMSTNNMGGLANRFGSEYHFAPQKDGDRNMTDFQMMAQSEYILDFFNEHQSIFSYADGHSAGGIKDNGIYNTELGRAHAYNVPHLDMFFDMLMQKSDSLSLILNSTLGGSVDHNNTIPPEHRGICMWCAPAIRSS